ncbi:MAG TPA: LacI family DNA-binding transcriptional regulator [Candidatus Sumerlaeota bacterium]|nr:LacI family DNA-binding transcriptional regulator [Candidatus Sumerlaeota bacterium]
MGKKTTSSNSTQVSTKRIAEIVGLARSTVVRALRNDPMIKAETIQRVQLVAQQMGYKHNHIARSLASGKTNIIGCIVPNVANPFFADMITEITTRLAEARRSVLLGVTNDSNAVEEMYLETFMNYRVDGILLATSREQYDQEYHRRLKDAASPVVFIGEGEPIGVDSVRADDETGLYELICFLKQNGYERIAFIGDLEAELHHSWLGRVDGYKRGLLENNLYYDPQYLCDCPRAADLPAVLDRLMRLPKPPEVVCAGNDRLAIELIHLLHKRGMRIPEDLAVVGFDNISMASEMSPRLTTVDLHIKGITNTAVERLLERIRSRQAGEDLEDAGKYHVRIKPELCIRETTRVLTGNAARRKRPVEVG